MIPDDRLNFKQLLKSIEAIVLDVDGVLSSSMVLIEPDGELQRTTNVKDGFAIQLALRMGLKVAIITGGHSKAVVNRFRKIGVVDIYYKVSDKNIALNDFVNKHNLNLANVLYMGDDLLDYLVMQRVGMATCPLDAAPEIKQISLYVSQYKGGEACVRDIIEQVLRTQDKWMTKEAFVL
ncbi:MAG TPA: HAD hydrolase family protein [Bacteroidales bacterium]|nr:HAD hydrolase family protein [Bacteroidales bacterium]